MASTRISNVSTYGILMGIAINYAVPVPTAGQIAYQGGRGLFEQERDKFLLGEEQFDERLYQDESQFARNLYQQGSQFDQSLAQRGSQFDRNLAQQGSQFDQSLAQKGSQFDQRLSYDQNLALLKDRQLQENQDWQSGERALEREAQGYDRQQSRYFDLAKMGLQNRANIAGENRANERLLSKESRQKQQQLQDQRYTRALAAADSIESDNRLNPAQRQQAIDQWDAQYGEMSQFDHQFPFQSSLAANTNRPDYGAMAADIKAQLGVYGEEDIGLFLRTGDDGKPVAIYEDPVLQSEAIRDHVFKRQDGERRDEMLEQADAKAVQDQRFKMKQAQFQAEKDLNDHKLAMAQLQDKQQKEAEANQEKLQAVEDKRNEARRKYEFGYGMDKGVLRDQTVVDTEMLRYDNSIGPEVIRSKDQLPSLPIGRMVRITVNGKWIEGTVNINPVTKKRVIVLASDPNQFYAIE